MTLDACMPNLEVTTQPLSGWLCYQSKSTAAAGKLIKVKNSHATTDHKGIGMKSNQGVSTHCNGLDAHQTCDYIKLSCET
jgi:hypothetical protein